MEGADERCERYGCVEVEGEVGRGVFYTLYAY